VRWVALLCLGLTGCGDSPVVEMPAASCVDTPTGEARTVTWVQMIHTGKTMVPVTHVRTERHFRRVCEIGLWLSARAPDTSTAAP
jgi:hypothetical protein